MNDDSFYGNIDTIKNHYINDVVKYIYNIKQKTNDILVLITNNNIIKKIILNKILWIKRQF